MGVRKRTMAAKQLERYRRYNAHAFREATRRRRGWEWFTSVWNWYRTERRHGAPRHMTKFDRRQQALNDLVFCDVPASMDDEVAMILERGEA
jgi:hypothetical protein